MAEPVTTQPAGSAPNMPDIVYGTVIEAGPCIIAIQDFGSPNWYSCQRGLNCLCYRDQISQCKTVDGKLFCGYGNQEFFMPKAIFECFCHCLLIHCFFCHPKDNMQGVANRPLPHIGASQEINKSMFFSGLLCCMNNCYCDFPDCCSASNKFSCIFCFGEGESMVLKCLGGAPDPDPEVLCICNRGTCWFDMPGGDSGAAIKSMQHCWCQDSRCALPCDEDVPCTFGMYGAICVVNWQPHFDCCPTIDALIALGKERGGAAAVPGVTVTQPNRA